MHIKRFEGEDLSEVMRRVREELGREAVVLHTKPIRREGIRGFLGRQAIEVLAAVDRESGSGDWGPGFENANPESRPPDPDLRTPTPEPRPPIPDIYAEVSQIKELLGRLLSLGRFGAAGSLQGPLRDLYEDLLHRGVLEPLAYEVVVALGETHRDDLPPYEDLRLSVGSRLGGMVKSAGLAAGTPRGSVVAFVGPTGVGKTTTLAKLAAHHRVAGGRDVAILSVDAYRIAAAEQLKTYAQIIGAPCEVALTPADLSRALERYREADLVFLDTTGRSPRDDLGIGEIRPFLAAARERLRSAARPIETHLVLSATAKGDDLLEAARRFAPLEPDRLTFTKIDETQSYGPLFNVGVLSDLPVAYLATGQEVPDDIEEASADRIANLVVFGGA